MTILGALGRRRHRALLLGGTVLAWLVAAIGALADHGTVLVVGLVGIGLASVVLLKMLLESHSQGRRDLDRAQLRMADELSATRGVTAQLERRLLDHDRSRAELHAALWSERRSVDALRQRVHGIETSCDLLSARLADLETWRVDEIDKRLAPSRRFSSVRTVDPRLEELNLRESWGGLSSPTHDGSA